MEEPIDEGGESPCYAHLLGEECTAEGDGDGDAPATVTGDEGE
jgi:hypothetical protein